MVSDAPEEPATATCVTIILRKATSMVEFAPAHAPTNAFASFAVVNPTVMADGLCARRSTYTAGRRYPGRAVPTSLMKIAGAVFVRVGFTGATWSQWCGSEVAKRNLPMRNVIVHERYIVILRLTIPGRLAPRTARRRPHAGVHLEENAEGKRKEIGSSMWKGREGEESVSMGSVWAVKVLVTIHATSARRTFQSADSAEGLHRWQARDLSSSAPQCSPRRYFQARGHHALRIRGTARRTCTESVDRGNSALEAFDCGQPSGEKDRRERRCGHASTNTAARPAVLDHRWTIVLEFAGLNPPFQSLQFLLLTSPTTQTAVILCHRSSCAVWLEYSESLITYARMVIWNAVQSDSASSRGTCY
ncbi:hypothetical protein C8R44DRAFT_848711 [Mycena epipterygia]|nr:hypothetical protein C8R44DRAFT_848711 [Mycena epipterygia]